MAKFIKFEVINQGATQPVGATTPVLVNVDKILSYLATGGGAIGNAKTLVIGLDNGGVAGSTDQPEKLTLAVSTSTTVATNPVFVSGQDNPLVKAFAYAITANPGGVASLCNLGVDQAATPSRMYWRTAVYS